METVEGQVPTKGTRSQGKITSILGSLFVLQEEKIGRSSSKIYFTRNMKSNSLWEEEIDGLDEKYESKSQKSATSSNSTGKSTSSERAENLPRNRIAKAK